MVYSANSGHFYKEGKCQPVNSAAQSYLTHCDPMDSSMSGFSVLHYLPEFALLKFMSTNLVRLSNHLILCHPPLLLPSILPSIRVFSNESVLCIWWPKYQSFSFSISPSNEYSGLISFRIDWFDLFAVQVLICNIILGELHLLSASFIYRSLSTSCLSFSPKEIFPHSQKG